MQSTMSRRLSLPNSMSSASPLFPFPFSSVSSESNHASQPRMPFPPHHFSIFTLPFPAFANFFSDDVSDDSSTYFPSMYDHMRDQAIAGTAAPRRRLRKLLMLVRSMLSRPPLSLVLSSSIDGIEHVYDPQYGRPICPFDAHRHSNRISRSRSNSPRSYNQDSEPPHRAARCRRHHK